MIEKAGKQDAAVLAALAAKLWEHEPEELIGEFAALLSREECALFLLWEEGIPAGFAQCQLRHDYVEGTETSPVGYLEGVYVEPAFRRKGFGAALVAACEAWAKSVGCTEFASDCELTNSRSLAFHLKIGFCEANRIVCFTKNL